MTWADWRAGGTSGSGREAGGDGEVQDSSISAVPRRTWPALVKMPNLLNEP